MYSIIQIAYCQYYIIEKYDDYHWPYLVYFRVLMMRFMKARIKALPWKSSHCENCLLQQEFVRSDVFEGTVGAYVTSAAKDLGGTVTFKNAVRFEKGEGIEKKQENFAEEIASMIKK